MIVNFEDLNDDRGKFEIYTRSSRFKSVHPNDPKRCSIRIVPMGEWLVKSAMISTEIRDCPADRSSEMIFVTFVLLPGMKCNKTQCCMLCSSPVSMYPSALMDLNPWAKCPKLRFAIAKHPRLSSQQIFSLFDKIPH